MEEKSKKEMFNRKKDFLDKSLDELSDQPVPINENKQLVLESYTKIRELLAKGHHLTNIAKLISEVTGMSEATFKKNYHNIRNEKKGKERGKPKMVEVKAVESTKITQKSTAEKFVEKHEHSAVENNFILLNDDI